VNVKLGRAAVRSGESPNIFQMLLVYLLIYASGPAVVQFLALVSRFADH